MDNISQRRSSEDAASMYLSFDAESTMSSACYKTLEAMTDISTISSLSTIEDAFDNNENKHMNSTLENNQDSQEISPLKTVKKMEVTTTNSPLRALPKNILREYKAMCSTPSKEQLLKTVEVTRGSDAARSFDLGVAFLGVEDEQPAIFPPPPPQQQHRTQMRCGDNKENTIPESDGSTLSVSSSVEIATSVIERKRFNSASTVESNTGEESIDEIKVSEVMIVDKITTDMEVQNIEKYVQYETKENATPKAKLESYDKIETINEDIEMSTELTPKVLLVSETNKMQALKSAGKPKIAVLASRNTRRSVCEPNLQTNKPSRISATAVKRQSLLPTIKKKTTASDIETEIPLLMDKMLKISNTSMLQNEVDGKSNKAEPPLQKQTLPTTDKRRSAIAPMKAGRSSLMPSTVGEKRPFSFTQRMSVVVKTTLNSPARKIARKSTMGVSNNMPSQQRRSMMTSRFAQTSRTNKVETDVRRSVLPNSKTASKSSTITTTKITTTTLKESTLKQRKSLYPTSKNSEETKIKAPPAKSNSNIGGLASKIPETIFTCNSCQEKFHIKSLLNAHRRSHEGDIVAPILNKKPTAVAASAASGGNSIFVNNQCKYCDKKFALVRALHIHLLQNCSKIPPTEKRKLHYTEMNHVEKARLPDVFHHGNGNGSAASSASATPRIKQNTFSQKVMDVSKNSAESAKEKDFKNKSSEGTFTTVDGNQSRTATATNSSIKKPTKSSAHSGVFKTPSKTVPCHICKLTFKSILDYTNHSLATHGLKTSKHNDSYEAVQ